MAPPLVTAPPISGELGRRPWISAILSHPTTLSRIHSFAPNLRSLFSPLVLDPSDYGGPEIKSTSSPSQICFPASMEEEREVYFLKPLDEKLGK